MKLKILRIHIEYHKKGSGIKIFMGEKWPSNGDFSPIFILLSDKRSIIHLVLTIC